MEAITNTTNEQKCNQNIVDAMPALYAFALQQQVPVSDTFCWHSQHCSTGAVCLHTRIKLYGDRTDTCGALTLSTHYFDNIYNKQLFALNRS